MLEDLLWSDGCDMLNGSRDRKRESRHTIVHPSHRHSLDAVDGAQNAIPLIDQKSDVGIVRFARKA